MTSAWGITIGPKRAPRATAPKIGRSAITSLSAPPPNTVRAAQYVRMSTEHQNYSIEHQQAAIAAYAAARGYDIVRTYADSGISGLTLRRRAGLKCLLSDVVGGSADFSVVLTFDVSRWGRFQDADESAHYEFLCRQAGVRVEYCAELFDNDGSVAATLLKQLKRAMAGEYSRELSVKVAHAQRRLAEKGFWVGGPPGYGLRRQLVSRDGALGQLMEHGERKALVDSRVIVTCGPTGEVAVVRRIFRMFVVAGLSQPSIARALNDDGIPSEAGGTWSPSRVRQVLTNERYVGIQVFGKTRSILGKSPRRRRSADWLRIPIELPPIVSPYLFDLAQRNIRRRMRLMTRSEMLTGLAGLLAKHGRLSATLINATEDLPHSATYANVFGGLTEAYNQVGYTPDGRATASSKMVRRGMPCTRRNRRERMPREEIIARLSELLRDKGRLSAQLMRDTPGMPCHETLRREFGDTMTAYELAGYSPTWKQRNASQFRSGATGGIALRTARRFEE